MELHINEIEEKYDLAPEAPEWNKLLNLLIDDAYSEIEANGPDNFFTKAKGRRVQITGIDLKTLERYYQGIKLGLVPHVKSPWPFKENSYIFEGPMRYHAGPHYIRGRAHMVMPPAADFPQITIAKKSTALPSLEAIASNGSMSTEMLTFMLAALKGNLTIAISGGTGAGKTTILEAMAKNFNMDARIGVAEDAPELYLSQPNVTYLHSVPWAPGMNPNDVATLSWAVAQFQRMRTDKIIIGETRGPEFGDFLIAANSGMDGSLTTLHANNPVQCLDKMTNFALRATNAPIRTVNNDIAQSVDLVIQLLYTADGQYRTAEICEITSTLSNDESAKITTNSLYKWDKKTDQFVKEANLTDKLRSKLENNGIDVTPFMQTPIGTRAGSHSNNEVAAQILKASGAGSHETDATIGKAPDSAPGVTNNRPMGLPIPGQRRIL